MYTLKDVATLCVDGDWIESKDQSQTGIRLIQTGNIGIGEYIDKIDRAKYISEETFYRLNCTEVLPGDVLISRLPDPVGRACVVPNRLGKAITAVDCTIIRLNESICRRMYLKYFTESQKYKYEIKQFLVGSTRIRISRKNLERIEIPLLSLDNQDYIVSVLDKVTDLINKRKEQLQKLDELVKARFVEMFGDPTSFESIYEKTYYGEQFNITSGGTPKTDVNAYWENGTIPWIGSNMCQNEIIYENDGKYITQLGLENSSAKIFRSGTVLVALVGATIGRTALLRFDTATNQNIAAIDVNGSKDFIPEFVYYHLQFLYNKFQEIGSGKFKMANQKFIKELPLTIPPIDLQNQFADFVAKVEKTKSTVQKALAETQVLFDSLMQQYFG